MYSRHVPMPEISEKLGIHLATLYRELKRGGAENAGDAYNPEMAQSTLKEHFKRRGHSCA